MQSIVILSCDILINYSHFDARNFPCENCGKEFKRKDKVCMYSFAAFLWFYA